MTPGVRTQRRPSGEGIKPPLRSPDARNQSTTRSISGVTSPSEKPLIRQTSECDYGAVVPG
jgi:hypothetical protein